MQRAVEPELLDELPANAAAAVRSRRDLQRVNRWMRNPQHVTVAIRSLPRLPRTILEIGAGDGTFMLNVLRRIGKPPAGARIQLLDMQPVIQEPTLSAFRALGWEPEVISENLHHWLAWLDSSRRRLQLRNSEFGQQAREESFSEGSEQHDRFDLICANLFLHHFKDAELKSFFNIFAQRCDTFIACEPRRWNPALVATRFLWCIGCNHVTRHDARISVRAGFRDRELTELWPADNHFALHEFDSGWASHLFIATRQ